MAVVDVLSTGHAPTNTQVGDVVRTAGGNYQVVAPNTMGAKFNPDSGFWSIKLDDFINNSLTEYERMLQQQQLSAYSNTQISQDFAREQMSYQSAQNAKAMDFNAQEAQKSRDWQERMSNTAHQRQVQDLMAAGLNPVLSAMSGNGAATTSGATASGVTSSGAQGHPDQSGSAAVGALMSQLLSRETSLDIAKIQSMTNMYMADQSAAAILGSASMSAQNQMSMLLSSQDFEEYLKKNYPNSAIGGISAILQQIFGGSINTGGRLSGLTNSLNQFKEQFLDASKRWLNSKSQSILPKAGKF